jgi:glutathione synthase/RimK-type ligase-like ATP-grasp enzyme
MRILILGSAETLSKNQQYYTEYQTFVIASAPAGREVITDIAYFDDLYIAIGAGAFTIRSLVNGVGLEEYDLILVRGLYFRNYMDILKTVSIYAKLHKVPIANDYSSYRSGSKLDQAVTFYCKNVSSPSTVVVTPRVLDMPESDIGFTFPCIMKSTLGAHGSDNYLVHTLQEVRELQQANGSLRFILQEFVPNDGDYRLLVIGGNMLAIKRTSKPGSHLNNTSQGGSASLTPLHEIPEPVQATAKALARDMGILTAGVDVLQDSKTGKYYVLEVNSQPQLVTGAFLDEKVVVFRQFLETME